MVTLYKSLKGTTKNDFRITPAASPGAPSSGQHFIGEESVDSVGSRFVCTVSGTPGTWLQLATNLKQAYDGGSLITTSIANRAVKIKRGSGSDSDNVFELQNGAGQTRFGFSADGVMKPNDTPAGTPGHNITLIAGTDANKAQDGGDFIIKAGEGGIGGDVLVDGGDGLAIDGNVLICSIIGAVKLGRTNVNTEVLGGLRCFTSMSVGAGASPGFNILINMQPTYTSTVGTQTGVRYLSQLSPTANTSVNYTGATFTHIATTAFNYTGDIISVLASSQSSSTGDLTLLLAADMNTKNFGASGTDAEQITLRLQTQKAGAKTVNFTSPLHILAPTNGAGTIVDYASITIDDITAVTGITNPFALNVKGGISRFAGPLDFPRKAVPSDPPTDNARLYTFADTGLTHLAYLDSTGTKTILAQAWSTVFINQDTDFSSSEYNPFDENNTTATFNTTQNSADRDIVYDPSTGLFTVTADGTYEIVPSLLIDVGGNTMVIVNYEKGGTPFKSPTFQVQNSDEPVPYSGSEIIDALAGNTLGVTVDGVNTVRIKGQSSINVRRIG